MKRLQYGYFVSALPVLLNMYTDKDSNLIKEVLFCFCYICIHVNPIYWLTCKHHFLFYSHVVLCICLIGLSWSDAGTIILFPFMAFPYMNAISSLNGQYSCYCCYTSAFVWALPVCWDVHPPGPPVSFLQLSCILVYPCMPLLCSYLCTCLEFHHLYLLHDCAWIAN